MDEKLLAVGPLPSQTAIVAGNTMLIIVNTNQRFTVTLEKVPSDDSGVVTIKDCHDNILLFVALVPAKIAVTIIVTIG